MKMTAQGTVFKYGDNVDTDVIIPARYLNIADPKELASHAMEDIDTEFVKNVKPGDIIVANKNFGCGSSREHAPRVLKDNGVACVIAASFARSRSHCCGRRRVYRFRHGRDYRRNHGRNLPGAALPRVHSEHHRQRRIAEQPQSSRHLIFG